jgi:hypothetical protein
MQESKPPIEPVRSIALVAWTAVILPTIPVLIRLPILRL